MVKATLSTCFPYLLALHVGERSTAFPPSILGFAYNRSSVLFADKLHGEPLPLGEMNWRSRSGRCQIDCVNGI